MPGPNCAGHFHALERASFKLQNEATEGHRRAGEKRGYMTKKFTTVFLQMIVRTVLTPMLTPIADKNRFASVGFRRLPAETYRDIRRVS